MNKIQFSRKDVNGNNISKDELESWYDENNSISGEIKTKLLDIIPKVEDNNAKELLMDIKNNIHDILLLTPENLKKWADKIDNNYKDTLESIKINVPTENSNIDKSLRSILVETFNYTNYRKNKLVELAKKINVKTCPYCNMHYTLYAEEGKNKSGHLAKFQFDHFYNKDDYPMLSMSLYNLIPSCGICNQSKSKKKLSLSFHPYHSYISKQFKFELNNPINLYIGAKTNDLIDVNFIATDSNKQSDLDVFVKTFHLKALYQRHGDIARETFDKAYEYPYYSNQNNFNWLIDKSSDYLKRLWFGTYMNEDEIEKRPMTKFIQDLAKQAKYRHITSK